MNILKKYFSDFTELLYPLVCPVCNNKLSANDISICLSCTGKLPETNFHNDDDNETAKIFWGRIPVEFATSFLRFEKGGIAQQLMHKLKYKGHQQIGIDLGRIFASRIGNTKINECNIIIPVPLHKNKLRKRGYNQSTLIAEGMSSILNIPVSKEILTRKIKTQTQTYLKKYERWENVKDVFYCSDISGIKDKHVLIIDDVITTGATIEACANVLLEAGAKKISIATLCYASQ